MLPLGDMLGPLGPWVATRHGAPSSQADLTSALSFSLMAIGRFLRREHSNRAARIVPARRIDVTGPNSASPLHGSTQNVRRSTECGSDGPQRADRVCKSSRTLPCGGGKVRKEGAMAG